MAQVTRLEMGATPGGGGDTQRPVVAEWMKTNGLLFAGSRLRGEVT